MYSSLLEMCGFEPQEMRSEKERIEKTFQALKISEKEITAAEKRIEQLYSIDLSCVRKMLKVWIRELIALVMAREEYTVIDLFEGETNEKTSFCTCRHVDVQHDGHGDRHRHFNAGSLVGSGCC